MGERMRNGRGLKLSVLIWWVCWALTPWVWPCAPATPVIPLTSLLALPCVVPIETKVGELGVPHRVALGGTKRLSRIVAGVRLDYRHGWSQCPWRSRRGSGNRIWREIACGRIVAELRNVTVPLAVIAPFARGWPSIGPGVGTSANRRDHGAVCSVGSGRGGKRKRC